MSTVTFKVDFGGAKRAVVPTEPVVPAIPAPPPPTRIMRQLAMAYFLEHAIEAGRLRDYAHAAKILGVSRARVSQVANLMLLDVATQEAILVGGSAVSERGLRGRTAY